MLMFIYTLHTQGPRLVESHICQNRADMGHPSFVMEQAVRNARLEVECALRRTVLGPELSKLALKDASVQQPPFPCCDPLLFVIPSSRLG